MTQRKDGDERENALDRIEANLQREEIDWEPTEVGDTVVGYVGAIEYVETKNGEMPVVAIDTKDGARVKVYCGRTRLRKQLAKNKVQPGDALGIRYEGEKASKSGGNRYFDYRVDVVRVGERKPDEIFRDTDDDDLVAGAVQASQDVWTQGSTDDEEPDF